MSKECITLTRKQWKHVLHTTIELARLAYTAHGTSFVETFLTRVSNDCDLMEADSSYPFDANMQSENVAGIIQDQTCEVNKLATAFRDYVLGLEVERAKAERAERDAA